MVRYSKPEILQEKCGLCGNHLQIKTNRANGDKFVGCSGYHSVGCRYTAHISTISKKDSVISRSEQIATLGDKMTQQQRNIVNAVVNGVKHIIIEALAGTGKTSAILSALKAYIDSGFKGSILVASFNKAIAVELSEKTTKDIAVSTYHALGRKILTKAMPKFKLLESKLYDIADNVIGKPIEKPKTPDDKDFNNKINAQQYYAVSVVKMLKANNLRATDENIDYINEFYGIVCDLDYPDANKHIDSILSKSVQLSGIIDFDDMIAMINYNDLAISNYDKYDLIVLDEAQDLSSARIAFIKRFLADNGRFIIVGDRNQAIYGFTGSTVDSMDKIADLLGDYETLPLTINQRCAKEIVNLAKEIVPTLEYADNAIQGTIKVHQTLNIDVINIGDMVLSRRNSNLVSLAYQLMRQGKKIYLELDIASNLSNLVHSVKHNNDLVLLVELLQQKHYDYALQTKNKQKIAELSDRINAIIAIIENSKVANVDALIKEIVSIFKHNDKRNAVKLISGHKSKGLESKVVHIIDYDRVRVDCNLEWQQQQESNLHYVMLTRAKEVLHLHKTM
jgi:DNA helicase-2/ATP-dependent DNA helicase PcrA